MEIAQIFIGADAVCFGREEYRYKRRTTSNRPSAGKPTRLRIFVALEIDIIILDGFVPRAVQRRSRCREMPGRPPPPLLNHLVIEAIVCEIVDVGIDGRIAPIEQQPRVWSAS